MLPEPGAPRPESPDLPSTAGFFRFRAIGARVVVTGASGDFVVLTQGEFERFAAGTIVPADPLYERLRERDLLQREGGVARLATRLRARKRFLAHGPNLHILVVTLRCNQTCAYCHASRAEMGAADRDMAPQTAERAVDLALRSTSPSLTFELQGGEPLANFARVRQVVEYALEKNRAVGKTLDFTLVTNLSLMDEEKLAFLLDHRVQICTSIDGPAWLHDRQRVLPGRSSHAEAARWIARINAAYAERGLDTTLYRVEALLTTTRASLPRWKEIVDTYVSLGCRALFLRPLDPFGFAERTGQKLGYPPEAFLEYWRAAVTYMLELNAQGVQVLERFASIFLTKILSGQDPNYLDIRNPCGAGIGQVAYDHDGRIFTCDEGRMLHATGDDMFAIGDLATSSYRDVVSHQTVRALAFASSLDAQPECATCAYNPYCGVCPVHHYRTQGSVFGRVRESYLCAVHKGIQDFLFERLAEADPATMQAFARWTTVRDRSHFVHACAT